MFILWRLFRVSNDEPKPDHGLFMEQLAIALINVDKETFKRKTQDNTWKMREMAIN